MEKKEKWINEDTDELFQVIVSLESVDEARNFLRDLLTENEIIECANRWKVVRMLDSNVQYLTIAEETGMSSTTIARISKWMKEGNGGYAAMLEKQKQLRPRG